MSLSFKANKLTMTFKDLYDQVSSSLSDLISTVAA